MGIYVEINNKTEENGMIYYTSYLDAARTLSFRFGIDKKSKKLFFWPDTNINKKPNKILTLDSDDIIGDFGIPAPIVAAIIRKVNQSMKNNFFPNDISFSS